MKVTTLRSSGFSHLWRSTGGVLYLLEKEIRLIFTIKEIRNPKFEGENNWENLSYFPNEEMLSFGVSGQIEVSGDQKKSNLLSPPDYGHKKGYQKSGSRSDTWMSEFL